MKAALAMIVITGGASLALFQIGGDSARTLRKSGEGMQVTASDRVLRGGAGLSYDQVFGQISERPRALSLGFYSQETKGDAALFRRLGYLRGGQALDDLFAKYHTNEATRGTAMSYALVGWLEADEKAGIEAAKKFLTTSSDPMNVLYWSGESFLMPFG